MNRTLLNRAGVLSGVAVAASALTLLAVRARAAGIPEADALTYTGYLEDANAAPLTGAHSISVQFWESEGADDALCAGNAPDTELLSGRFQVALPKSCADAVKANPDVWVDVMVDGAPLGRTKLGAVPYALEAGHAANADDAAHAVNAEEADVADALTASAILGVPVVREVAASDTLTEKVDFPASNATYLLTAVLSGAGSDVHQTYVVHTARTALNVHAQLLLADSFSTGKIEVETQNGAPGWSFNPAGGLMLSLIFTNGPTNPATASYTLVRLH